MTACLSICAWLAMTAIVPRWLRLERAGQPVVRYTWQDVDDLGAQYFLWEFAVAVAGYRMDIQPFDQPKR